MENIIIGIISFIVIFVILFLYYLLYAGWIKLPEFKNKKKSKVKILEEAKKKEVEVKKDKKEDKEKIKHLTEVKFLMNVYHLNWKLLYFKRLLFVYAFLDALIIVLTFEVIMLLKWALLFRLLVAFVLVLGLIYSLYSILGSYLLKKGYDTNEF